jgi:serine/threonine protein kinase/Tfp pilus assembly protein PilF
MLPQRWEKVEQILNAALDLEAGARSVFLNQACAGDRELRREVETLIKSYESADNFIERPILDEIKKTDEFAGMRVGAYVLEKEIGRGGMGLVYAARRDDGEFFQRVAVKLIKTEGDADFAARRFRLERQILAALNHPFIARLFDGGTTADGLPYLVMELVEGEPLNGYSKEKDLPVKMRLRLFLQICAAVAEAHRNGVLHRDLKPSNILIKADGTPKLLDFGISKLLENQPKNPDLLAETRDTTSRFVRLLTPEYASPEQIFGEELSPASDIYSLGVILYELLTGARPYEFSNNSFAAIARVIMNQRVEDLDTKIKAENAADLNAIVQKMLAKRAENRYASVKDLISDLENYLEGLPVKAATEIHNLRTKIAENSPETKRTTLAVLPFKNLTKTEETSELLLGLGIADALITKLSGIKQIVVRPTGAITKYTETGADYAEIARELKVENLLDGLIMQHQDRLRVTVQLINTSTDSTLWAAKFNEKLLDIFDIQDLISEQVAASLEAELTETERAILAKRGTENLEAYDAYLRGRAIWHSYTEQGLARAREFFEKAVALDPNFAAAHSGIADFYIAAGIVSVLPPAEAFKIAKDSAAKAVALDPNLGEAYASLGFATWAYDWDTEEAERLFRKCFALNENYAPAHEWFAHVLASQGQFDEAVDEMKRALEINPQSSQLTAMTAYIHHNARRHAEGVLYIERARELEPENYLALQGFGWMYPPLGRAREAIPFCQKAVELSNRSPFCLWVLGEVYVSLNERAEVEKLIAELKEMSEHRYVSPYYLAMLYTGLGEKDAAFMWLEKVITDREYWAQWLNVEYRFDRLRDDPRFDEILRRVHKQNAAPQTGQLPETSPTRQFPETSLTAKNSNWKRILAIAASAILLIVFAAWYFSKSSPKPTDRLQNLTKNVAEDVFPRLSPDGKHIAFISNRDGIAEIYTMNSDGKDVRRITFNHNEERTPAWTPDGRHIVFESLNSERDESDIWIIDADGANQVDLTNAPGIDSRPAVSPDGRQIAFSSNRGGRYALYLMNIDGTNQHRLTDYTRDETEPAWSPDGKQIAFARRVERNITNICLMNADGSGLVNLTNSTASINNTPAFSHDGRFIVFQSSRDVPPNHVDLWIMKPDGSEPQIITPEHKGLNGEPNWSSDDRHVIFNTDRNGNYEIYSLDLSDVFGAEQK